MNQPIIAYRSWGVSVSPRRILSIGNNTNAWPALSAPSASCRYEPPNTLSIAVPGSVLPEPETDYIEHHEAPKVDCRCGYYAMKDVASIPLATVYGRVALWGRIIEHEYGYRAQYAYPQVLFLNPHDDEKMKSFVWGYGLAVSQDVRDFIYSLASEYGCEVAPMPQELVDSIADRNKAIAEEASLYFRSFLSISSADAVKESDTLFQKLVSSTKSFFGRSPLG